MDRLRCENCKHFKATQNSRGICDLLIGSINEECYKWQWCSDFIDKEK